MNTLYTPLPVDIKKSVEFAAAITNGILTELAPKKGALSGGYEYIRGRDGACLLLKKAGLPDPNKEDKYKRFALEKGERLHANSPHLLSFQSMDVELERYQGASRMENGWIHSFSGLPSPTDEGLTMTVGVRAGWSSSGYAREVMQISDNVDHFLELHRLSKWVVSNM